MYLLLIDSFVVFLFSYAIIFDNRNPVMCRSLDLLTKVRKGSFLHKLFPHKLDALHPHSFLYVIPFIIAFFIFAIVSLIYIVFWITNIDAFSTFLNSRVAFFMGGAIVLSYFVYPVLVIIINKIFEIKENRLSKEEKEELYKSYDRYIKDNKPQEA